MWDRRKSAKTVRAGSGGPAHAACNAARANGGAMHSDATILLDLHDVELVEPAEPRQFRYGRLRIFLLSVLLGLTLGMAFSVMDPVGSKRASLALRGRFAAARGAVVAFAANERARVHAGFDAVRRRRVH
jgi:hypothetical protein